MSRFEAIYGVFKDQEGKVLLLHRPPTRTHRQNSWDLMGGYIRPGLGLQQTFVRDVQTKLGVRPDSFMLLPHPLEILEESGEIGLRHVIVGFGHLPVSRETLHSKIYDDFRWVDGDELDSMNLHPGLQAVLREVKALR